MNVTDDFQKKLDAKYADDVAKARALGNQYSVDMYGRFPWDRSERRGRPTNLSKTSLGEFTFAVLSCGGAIDEFWVFNHSYVRSAVFVRVHLSIAQKEKIEAETEFRFDPPPVVHLNSGSRGGLLGCRRCGGRGSILLGNRDRETCELCHGTGADPDQSEVE